RRENLRGRRATASLRELDRALGPNGPRVPGGRLLRALRGARPGRARQRDSARARQRDGNRRPRERRAKLGATESVNRTLLPTPLRRRPNHPTPLPLPPQPEERPGRVSQSPPPSVGAPQPPAGRDRALRERRERFAGILVSCTAFLTVEHR